MSELNIEAPEGEDGVAELPPLEVKPAAKPKAKAKPAVVFEDAAPVAPKKIRIILEENDNIPPTGLFLGINGRSFMVRPGEEVDVPPEVVECLNDAVMATPKTDSNGNITDFRNRLRFPYRIVSQSV